MRKIVAGLFVFGISTLGVAVPVTTAQAAASNCDNAYNAADFGYFYAYDASDCRTLLGRTQSWDSDWGNSTGPFQGGDSNAARSILNKGTSGAAVQVFNGAGQDWAGGNACLTTGEVSGGEAYMSDLAGQYFSSGFEVNNKISSHRWIDPDSCSTFLDS